MPGPTAPRLKIAISSLPRTHMIKHGFRAAAPADRRLSWRLMLCPSPLVLTLAVPSANQPVFVAALVINRLMGWYLVPAWFPWPAAPILLAPWREGVHAF